ncbi:MAG TPA: hypothetical protein DHW45_19695 [Candidatus Latescibacteria bacterium]|nr:hypothetical protein [Candidatus Latescibacterota bacterium]
MLVERRIDQDTEVSREITLWSQRGSDVIRGNLLVIPIEDSFIYVEPLYLRATQAGMPELKRVLVVKEERVVMAENLELALQEAFSTIPDAEPTPAPGGDVPPLSLANLTSLAVSEYEKAQRLLKTGDFKGYGEAVDQLGRILKDLGERTRGDD